MAMYNRENVPDQELGPVSDEEMDEEQYESDGTNLTDAYDSDITPERSLEYKMRLFLAIVKAFAMYLAIDAYKKANQNQNIPAVEVTTNFMMQTVANIVDLICALPGIGEEIDLNHFQQQYQNTQDFIGFFATVDPNVLDQIYRDNHSQMQDFAVQLGFFDFNLDLMIKEFDNNKMLFCKVINSFLAFLRDETHEEPLRDLDETDGLWELPYFPDLLELFMQRLSAVPAVALAPAATSGLQLTM